MTARRQHRHQLEAGVVGRMQAMWRDRAIREMLGCWVSELEPAVLYNEQGRLIGLTMADIPIGAEAPVGVEWWGEPI